MNVYTYYMPVPELYTEDTQRELIKLWAKGWKKRGWNPMVLNERHATHHPRYAEFKRKFWELPTEYGHRYEGACFMRWVAVAAMGGGMLTDYDVMNYSFLPQAPEVGVMKIFANNPPDGIFLGMVLAPRDRYEAMCQMFFEWQVTQADWNPHANLYHCSDLSLLHRMYHHHNYPIPAWLRRVPGCGLYTQPGWETAPAVHFGYEMHHAGLWPKYKHIENLRPL